MMILGETEITRNRMLLKTLTFIRYPHKNLVIYSNNAVLQNHLQRFNL